MTGLMNVAEEITHELDEMESTWEVSGARSAPGDAQAAKDTLDAEIEAELEGGDDDEAHAGVVDGRTVDEEFDALF